MPNWCHTTYHVVGDKKEIQALKKVLDANYRRKNLHVPNGFGTMSIDNIIDALGYDCDAYSCVGEIVDYEITDDVLVIEQRTAWCEQEGFREVIQKSFPTLTVYFRAEELDGAVFETNSFDEFPERYVLYNYEEMHYFLSIDEAVKYVSNMVGYTVDGSVDAIVTALGKYLSQLEDPDAQYLYYCFLPFSEVK